MESFFKLHVVPPPKPLDWGSPRGLLRDTLIHHVIQDPAPIGHFYIEIKSGIPGPFGVRHVLTGMSRAHRNRSTLKVIRDQVGLGTFFYDFPGMVDHGLDSLKKLEWARALNRLKTVVVPLDESRAALLLEELDLWLKHGCHRHYGGGHRILKGEGSGCAEFGAHFFNLASGKGVVPAAWIRSVYAPKELVGGPRTDRRVSLFRVFLDGRSWASDESTGILYSTPDMELAWKWLESLAPGTSECILDDEAWRETGRAARRIEFDSAYPRETEEGVRALWRRISLA